MNSTWLITSELANQRARKALFTCVVYTNDNDVDNENDIDNEIDIDVDIDINNFNDNDNDKAIFYVYIASFKVHLSPNFSFR